MAKESYRLEAQPAKGESSSRVDFSTVGEALAAYHRKYYELSVNPRTVLDFRLSLSKLSGAESEPILSTDPYGRAANLRAAEKAKGDSLLDSYLRSQRSELDPR